MCGLLAKLRRVSTLTACCHPHFASLESVTSLALAALFLSGVDPPTRRGSSARKPWFTVVTRVCSLMIGPSEAGPQTTGCPGPARCRPSSVVPILGEMRSSWSFALLLELSCFLELASRCYPTILKRSGDGSKAPAGGCRVGMRGHSMPRPGHVSKPKPPMTSIPRTTKLPMLSLSGLLLSHTAVCPC